jgi:hypothetical protein
VQDRRGGGVPQRSFHYGATSDRPVVGDWDGNGTYTVGVVRSRTFYLRNRTGGGKLSAALGFAG